MSTILFKNLIFGPVHSRRLGNSLGINLLPTHYKYCNFNCIYCECGLTFKEKFRDNEFPTTDDLIIQLEKKLSELKTSNSPIDNITFAGNGEPTIHPNFPEIVDVIIELRNKYYPIAKISTLTNAIKLDNPVIKEAIKKTDNPILKLDAGTEETFNKINCPIEKVSLKKTVENLISFGNPMIIQTLFLRAEIKGEIIDNTLSHEVDEWLKHLNIIKPDRVMIYPVARETPFKNIQKISLSVLESIAEKVRVLGLNVDVYH